MLTDQDEMQRRLTIALQRVEQARLMRMEAERDEQEAMTQVITLRRELGSPLALVR